MVVMFGMGRTIKLDDFKVVFTQLKDVLIGCLAQFTVMPVLTFSLGKIFGLEAGLLAGVILVGTCPGGTSSNVITYMSCKCYYKTKKSESNSQLFSLKLTTFPPSYCIFLIVIAVNPADSVFDSGGKLNYLLEVVTLCELDTSQIETVALWGTGPVAINVEHRLQTQT